MCFRDILQTYAPIEGSTEGPTEWLITEEPLEEYDVYDQQNEEPIADPNQLDYTEHFTEDHTEPPKTEGAESRCSCFL